MAECINDIGEKKRKPVICYLTSSFNYINHLRKEVACIHVDHIILAELYKWNCEDEESDLFPFDVAKCYGEMHTTRRLGRPSIGQLDLRSLVYTDILQSDPTTYNQQGLGTPSHY